VSNRRLTISLDKAAAIIDDFSGGRPLRMRTLDSSACRKGGLVLTPILDGSSAVAEFKLAGRLPSNFFGLGWSGL
jgi:hypothetical protein